MANKLDPFEYKITMKIKGIEREQMQIVRVLKKQEEKHKVKVVDSPYLMAENRQLLNVLKAKEEERKELQKKLDEYRHKKGLY